MITLERQLESFCDDDPIYAHLYELWKNAKFDLEKILQNIILIFPHYSLHNASHSEMIIRYIEAVLGEERIKMLKPTEIWLMLMSAYAHDVGMLVSDKDVRSYWQGEDFKDYLEGISDSSDLRKYAEYILKPQGEQENLNLPSEWPVDVKMAVIYLTADYVRRRHPERSKEIITARMKNSPIRFDFSFLHFIKERIQLLLGKLASLHGASFDDIFTLEKCCQGMGQADDIVYPRRIAAFLRLGDLLDLDNKRFDENAYALIGDVPTTTEAHRAKHASLEHFLVRDNKIEVAYDCPTEDAYLAASGWISYLKQETENLALRWNDIVSDGFGSAPVVTSCKIKLNGELIQGNALNSFKFTKDTIFELLQGANIYRNQFACVRELIQNADDASKLRLWEDLKAGNVTIPDPNDQNKNLKLTELIPFDIKDEIRNRYPIEVTLQYDEKERRVHVIISDKGIGISEQQLKQMGNVSESWHMRSDNKRLYANMLNWLTPTGAFGLGLQSVFQLTDTLHCVTYPRHEDAKEIIFRSKQKGGRITTSNLVTEESYRDGTTFDFFIPEVAFSHVSWSIGGLLDQKLNEIDPFEYTGLDIEKAFLLYYIVDCIYYDVNNNFFPIKIKIKGKDGKEDLEEFQVSQKWNYEEWNRDPNRLMTTKDGLSVTYDYEKNVALAYDKKFGISYVIRIKNDKNSSHETRAFFKGVRLDSSQFNNLIGNPYYSYLSATIYLDGLPTREYLTLSREKIREEKWDILRGTLLKDIFDVIRFLIGSYIKNNVDDSQLAFSLACLMGGFLHPGDTENDIHTFRDGLISHLTTPIKYYSYHPDSNDEIKVQTQKIEAKEFFEKIWRKAPFWIIKMNDSFYEYPFYVHRSDEETCKEVHESIVQCGVEGKLNQDTFIFIDGMIKEILSIYNLSSKYITGSIEHKNILYQCELNPDITIPEVSPSIKTEINDKVRKDPRLLTDAIADYRALAIVYSKKHLSYHHRFQWGLMSKAYMISPFSKEDVADNLDKIKSELDLKLFWNRLINREDFKSLVRYVKENNLNPEVTEEEIQADYHKWIMAILGPQISSKNEENNA